MIRSFRFFLAASAALLCAAPDAFAQVPVYTPPPPPPSAAPPPPAYPPPTAQPYPPAAQPAPQQLKSSTGPGVQLEAFTGWQVNGDVDGIYGKLAVDDSQSFGVSLWKSLGAGSKLELLWIYSNYDARFDSYTYTYQSTKSFNIMTNYFQIGGVHSMRRGRIEPFAGGTLGAAWYSPGNIQAVNGTTYNGSDTWRFAITLGGGLNVFLSEKLALRAHARMLMPMYFNGGSVYVGSGGSGMAVNAGVPAISGDFGLGLVFAP